MRFRVVGSSPIPLVREGAIVTGLGITATAFDGAGLGVIMDPPWIAVRVAEEDVVSQAIGRHPREGWPGAAIRPERLEPLDDDARALLREATGL